MMKLATSAHKVQFSLLSLLEYITLSSILLSISSIVGVAASAALMLMALALWMRRGFLVLIMWMTASLVAEIPRDAAFAHSTLFSQLATTALAGGLVAWYGVRRHLASYARTGNRRTRSGERSLATLLVRATSPIAPVSTSPSAR